MFQDVALQKGRIVFMCQKLYQEPMDFGSWSHLSGSNLAVFLRQIGQHNAADLRRLEVVVARTSLPGDAGQSERWTTIHLVTQLLKVHAPRFQRIKFCRDLVNWDEFENGPFEPVKNGTSNLPSWKYLFPSTFGSASSNQVRDLSRLWDHEIFYRATEDLVKEIPWLEELRVTGMEKDDPNYQKIQELQESVNNGRRSIEGAEEPSTRACQELSMSAVDDDRAIQAGRTNEQLEPLAHF